MPRDEAEVTHAIVTLTEQGHSQRKIAEKLGVGRKLVRATLERMQVQRTEGHSALPEPPQRRPSQLDPYQSQMLSLLDRYPDISAVRMLEELRQEGFKGGYSVVKERLRTLGPKETAAFVERFETGPGEQGQQDWSPYTVDFTAEGKRKVRCFSLVLAYSRRQYIHFCDREDLLTMERQHIAAAERFGGLPREILYGNQRAVVLRRELGRPVYNPKFLAFAAHYGFTPRALPPRTPKWKGKVEAPFKYVEGNCLRARTLRDKGELDILARTWMDQTSDLHMHDTTRERPIDRFAREREALLPLPAKPYDTAEVAYRVVSDEALVHWEDVRYSVPISALLNVVVVRATEHEVFIYRHDLSLLARHERAARGHKEPVVLAVHRPPHKARHDVEVEAWADYLGHPQLTVALLDKLLYRALAIRIDGPSYRLAQHKKRQVARRTLESDS